MHVVIFSGGNAEGGQAVSQSLKNADYIIAADSGAETALTFGVVPSVVLGDFDSLSANVQAVLKKKHVVFESFQAEKDETDTELALLFALKKRATTIDIVGGVEGNRLDHVLANVCLTFSSAGEVRFVNGNQVCWITHGPTTIRLRATKGDLLSLLPLSETIEGITTTGLTYSLHQETLILGKARGISNVMTSGSASVSFSRGVLLFIHTLTVKKE